MIAVVTSETRVVARLAGEFVAFDLGKESV
jgi:hypothetical protein